MNQRITHSGVVDSMEDGCVHVRIVQTSACAACKVAGYCNAAVSTSGQVAAKALLWAFGVPFVLLIVVLVLVLLLTNNEGWAALGALMVLAPYYIVLWLLRDKMREQLAFRIE